MTFKFELFIISIVLLKASIEKYLANKSLYCTMKNKQ